MPDLPTLNGIEYRNLIKEFASPIISSRPDGVSCTRLYSVAWADAYDFQLALRGLCTVEGTGTSAYFSRTHPDSFDWDNAWLPFVCTSVTQIKPEGIKKNANGTIDTQEYDEFPELLVPCEKAHITAEYEAKRYLLADDDETNDAVVSGDSGEMSPDLTDPGGQDAFLTYHEWDRYCEWTMEWGVETLTAPIGAYNYVTQNIPINNYVQFQQQMATITCRVYGLPMMPPSAFKLPGTVNHRSFTFYLDQYGSAFTADAETMLFQPPGVEFGINGDMTVSYNMIYRWIYRPQKHNFFFYYPGAGSSGGSGSGARRWSWERIALDVSNPGADGSAPFSLRNMGYLWSPQELP